MDADADRRLDYAGAALAVVVALAVALLVFGALQAAGGPSPPDAQWSIERVNDTDVRIEHVGNETVFAGDLSITVDGRVRAPPFSGSVRPGDSGTIDVATPSTVKVHWTGGSGTRDVLSAESV